MQREGKFFVAFLEEKSSAPSSRGFRYTLKPISENEPAASADSKADEVTYSVMLNPSGRQQSAAKKYILLEMLSYQRNQSYLHVYPPVYSGK